MLTCIVLVCLQVKGPARSTSKLAEGDTASPVEEAPQWHPLPPKRAYVRLRTLIRALEEVYLQVPHSLLSELCLVPLPSATVVFSEDVDAVKSGCFCSRFVLVSFLQWEDNTVLSAVPKA